MALITLKTIQATKIQRSRTWLLGRIKAGDFPKPAVLGTGAGGNLWDSADVDRWVEEFKVRAAATNPDIGQAQSARSKRLPHQRDSRVDPSA